MLCVIEMSENVIVPYTSRHDCDRGDKSAVPSSQRTALRIVAAHLLS